MSILTVSITPYLHFGGHCEEAINFYQSVIGGHVEIVNRYDNSNMNAPDEYKNKVLHARFHYDGTLLFMACDVFPGEPADKTSGAVALSLEVNDLDEAKKLFSGLADGGKVHVPFEKQFWGAWHGNLTDCYGIRWMVNH